MNVLLKTDRSRKKKGAVILMVEDDFAIRELMKACLEIEGFEVITPANGLDGLRRYMNKDQVQIVVTDLDMSAMNGTDMIQQIFEITPQIKVIVASGRADCYAQEQEPNTPASCLLKPYTGRELTVAIQLLLSTSLPRSGRISVQCTN